ncbi:SDR family NAD(P)-dependent oxidoreductase [Aeromicrobium sp.]|uniref:SDR family oxidoreductase n=1 Tax=Aeromicrobium sp. TaxID=1871063 RepID=UPI0019992D56|nr:SDR family NAD(P)-dependent oxidoreductase [Aeromicrobium sp.]MBC7631669.1 SDR family oxidoreductase [Aeromicrobium sp.]
MSVARLLDGKVAIVTGGTRGIGGAIATTFAEHGATVVALATSPVRLANVDTRVCDVSDEASVMSTFGSALADHGRIDVLVNNAGVAIDSVIHRGSLEDFRRVLDVNLQGTWLCTREALRHMRDREGGGAIVNIASIASKAGNLGQAAYVSSKAGVEALTRTTAREGARHGIRANAIRPGLIATDMTAGMPQHSWEEKLASIPMARPGDPREVAEVALFLASDMSSYMTGAVLDVAGGREM